MGSSSPPLTASAVLLDIEGTITSISFVKDVLFPHAVSNVERFLGEAWQEAQVQAAVDGMRKQAADDADAGIQGVVAIPPKDSPKEDQIKGVSENLKWLISIDNKGTHMKALSGLIWQKGYESGDIKGHLYDDVKPAIENWKENGKKIFIYSSGSVHAQKLIMKYSVLGNLESLIDGYFDTNVGHKRELSSYKNILEKIGFAPEETVFLTDIVEEGDAAKEAGINVVLVSREGNAPLSEESKKKYTVISSCAELNFSVASKRKSSDEESLPPAKIHKGESDVTEKNESDKTQDPSNSMEIEVENKCADQTDTLSTQNTKIDLNIMDKKNLDDVEKTEKIEKTETCLTAEKSQETLQMETETISHLASSLATEESNTLLSEKNNDCTDIDIENDTNVENGKEFLTKSENEAKLEPIQEEALCIEKDKISPDEIVDVLGDVNTIEESEIIMPSDDIHPTQHEDDAKSNVIIPDCLPVTAEIPIVHNDEDEEKLNQLLGEEGIALEKECEEILSKMEQVTKVDILAQNKVPIHRVIEEKLDDLDDIQVGDDGDTELLLDVGSTNNKISVNDLVDTVTTDVLDILPDIPSEVEPIILNKEIIENNGVKEENGNKDTENGASNSDQCETNGVIDTCDTAKNKTEIVNGKMNNEVNGKDAESLPEKELNGNTKNDIHAESKTSNDSHVDEKTLNTTDASNQEEIKVKKITSEEPAIDPPIEQVVEA